MPDVFNNPVYLPDLSSNPTAAPSGYVGLFFKSGVLYQINDGGNIQALAYPVTVYSTTTNGDGEWSVSYAGQWATVYAVMANVISASNQNNNIEEMYFAHRTGFDNNGVSGTVTRGNDVALNSVDGITFAGAGIQVRVEVFGIPSGL